MNMQKQSLKSKLSGNLFEDGTIDIENYIAYLDNFSSLCKKINNCINPATELKLKLSSDIEKGSIILSHLDVIIATTSFLASNYTPKDLLEFIGFLNGKRMSLMDLFKITKDKELITTVEIDDNMIRLELQSKNSEMEAVEICKDLFKCWKDTRVKSAFSSYASFLNKEGVDSVGYQIDKQNYNYITKEDARYIEFDTGNKALESVTSIEFLNIIDLPTGNFLNKWRFSTSGGRPFWAHVKDQVIINKVQSEGIKPPFILKAKVKKEMFLNEEGLLMEGEREILEAELMEQSTQKIFFVDKAEE
jgi:hypothetical protein